MIHAVRGRGEVRREGDPLLLPSRRLPLLWLWL